MKRFFKTPPIWVLIVTLLSLFGLFFAFIPNALNFNHYPKRWVAIDEAPATEDFFIPTKLEVVYLFQEYTLYSAYSTTILLFIFVLICVKTYRERREEFWIGLITLGTMIFVFLIIPGIYSLREVDLETEDYMHWLYSVLIIIIVLCAIKYVRQKQNENRWINKYIPPGKK